MLQLGVDKATGRIVHIQDATNGLSCGCICTECDELLEAVQGPKKEWHFRHSNATNCTGGPETALHRLAKQIICENSNIRIEGATLNYTDACQEKALETIVPDVSVNCNGIPIHFEIRVTHPVDADKERFYNERQYKSIEINLNDVPYDITPEKLKALVLDETRNKRKIFWEIPPSPEPVSRKTDPLETFLVIAGILWLARQFSRSRNR